MKKWYSPNLVVQSSNLLGSVFQALSPTHSSALLCWMMLMDGICMKGRMKVPSATFPIMAEEPHHFGVPAFHSYNLLLTHSVHERRFSVNLNTFPLWLNIPCDTPWDPVRVRVRPFRERWHLLFKKSANWRAALHKGHFLIKLNYCLRYLLDGVDG